MMRELRKAFHRPWSPPAPKLAVHVGAALMRTDPALALAGRRCVPDLLQRHGFQFIHPDFAGAIKDLSERALD
jgi:NAD dependent epimerase/dehydratase family enzyme